jgi:hypothetical protein
MVGQKNYPFSFGAIVGSGMDKNLNPRQTSRIRNTTGNKANPYLNGYEFEKITFRNWPISDCECYYQHRCFVLTVFGMVPHTKMSYSLP